MSKEQAAALVSRLLRGFPYLNPHDPEGYITALVQVMSGYPMWAGEQAITRVNEKNPEFPPSDRLLKTWLDEIVKPFRFAAQWNGNSVKQIEEQRKLEERKSKQTYEEFKAEMAAKGLPICRNDPIQHGETPQRVQAKLRINAAEWDALPDRPPSGHWERLRSNAIAKSE